MAKTAKLQRPAGLKTERDWDHAALLRVLTEMDVVSTKMPGRERCVRIILQDGLGVVVAVSYVDDKGNLVQSKRAFSRDELNLRAAPPVTTELFDEALRQLPR